MIELRSALARDGEDCSACSGGRTFVVVAIYSREIRLCLDCLRELNKLAAKQLERERTR